MSAEPLCLLLACGAWAPVGATLALGEQKRRMAGLCMFRAWSWGSARSGILFSVSGPVPSPPLLPRTPYLSSYTIFVELLIYLFLLAGEGWTVVSPDRDRVNRRVPPDRDQSPPSQPGVCGFWIACRVDFTTGTQVILRGYLLKLGQVAFRRKKIESSPREKAWACSQEI